MYRVDTAGSADCQGSANTQDTLDTPEAVDSGDSEDIGDIAEGPWALVWAARAKATVEKLSCVQTPGALT